MDGKERRRWVGNEKEVEIKQNRPSRCGVVIKMYNTCSNARAVGISHFHIFSTTSLLICNCVKSGAARRFCSVSSTRTQRTLNVERWKSEI